MRYLLFGIVFLLVTINIMLNLPKAAELVQAKVAITSSAQQNVLGKEKIDQQVLDNMKSLPKSQGKATPQITATAALVADLDSNSILFVKDPNKRVPIASTTKIMTALIGAEYFKFDELLVVSNSALVEGSSMDLVLGEKITFKNLLLGLLLNSGNDAAFTIAANYSGGMEGFVLRMNQKAAELGLQNTHFQNPAGFDNPLHFSSAWDLNIIAQEMLKDTNLSRIVATKEAVVASSDQNTIHSLKNINKLLATPGFIGIKTGFTPAAKENFIGLVERDGHKILTVVLGSDDRFGETQTLVEWTFDNFSWN